MPSQEVLENRPNRPLQCPYLTEDAAKNEAEGRLDFPAFWPI